SSPKNVCQVSAVSPSAICPCTIAPCPSGHTPRALSLPRCCWRLPEQRRPRLSALLSSVGEASLTPMPATRIIGGGLARGGVLHASLCLVTLTTIRLQAASESTAPRGQAIASGTSRRLCPTPYPMTC